MNFFKHIIFVLILTFGYSKSANAQSENEDYKVVFQLTDASPTSQKALVNQLKNLTRDWPSAKLSVVVHSGGIQFLVSEGSNYGVELAELEAKGVEFKACENTLNAKNISKSELFDFVKFVPMGIKEIVEKQAEGWYYIKAGI
ncbi:DsrE family protein [Psychroflexus aestuariivivens]|uniref:DsrE family protein n=1 Tax=Psychroflexus aestuariivivens TaxID=1795040 RepID=UPI000FDB4A62|nr:DsrE family protein [Psychroflexus aestuariivivens]